MGKGRHMIRERRRRGEDGKNVGMGEREHVLWIPHLGVLTSVDTVPATAGVWICLHVT